MQLEPSARTTGVMTTSDRYVLKGHIQTERQNFFSKIESYFARHMLAWGFGDFKGGEIIPCEIVPGRNPPPPLYGLKKIMRLMPLLLRNLRKKNATYGLTKNETYTFFCYTTYAKKMRFTMRF